MRKVCVVITARPSYSRIKTVLAAINEHPDLQLLILVTGSALLGKYGAVNDQIEKDGFPITARLYNVLEGNGPLVAVKATAIALMELSTWFDHIKPDVVITIADRFETLATAAAASYMNITLVHIQGGEITGSIDDKVRHAVTQLADLHFVASEKARQHVLKMGKDPETVYDTGCPSIDIAALVLDNPFVDFNPFGLSDGAGAVFDHRQGYAVVMQHPVTTEYQLSGNQIKCTWQAVEKLNIPTFWFWPNPDPGTEEMTKQLETFRKQHTAFPVYFFKSLDTLDFLKLLKNASCLIGNSSVGIRECCYLGVPVVNIGSRQQGRQRGSNVIDAAHDVTSIRKAIAHQVAHGPYKSDCLYGNGNSGKKIVSILAQLPLSSNKTINC